MQNIFDRSITRSEKDEISETGKRQVRNYLLGISTLILGLIVLVGGVVFFSAYILFWPRELGSWAFAGAIGSIFIGTMILYKGGFDLRELFSED